MREGEVKQPREEARMMNMEQISFNATTRPEVRTEARRRAHGGIRLLILLVRSRFG